MMADNKRSIEIFTAGCPLCKETTDLVNRETCNNCEVKTYDLREGCITNECLEKAKKYGIHRVPAVVVDGKLIGCCENQTPISLEALRSAGLGQTVM